MLNICLVVFVSLSLFFLSLICVRDEFDSRKKIIRKAFIHLGKLSIVINKVYNVKLVSFDNFPNKVSNSFQISTVSLFYNFLEFIIFQIFIIFL